MHEPPQPVAAPPEPARVKVYGLVALTRRRYLVIQTVAAVMLVAMLGVWVLLMREYRARPAAAAPSLPAGVMPERQPEPPPGWVGLVLGLAPLLPWLIAAALVGGLIETYFVLKRFARQEAARPAGAPGRAP
jgi:hypothetical protein